MQDNLQDPVVGWYCECKASAHTVGCCAHVATIIWYLGKGKQSQYKPKSLDLQKITNSFKWMKLSNRSLPNMFIFFLIKIR